MSNAEKSKRLNFLCAVAARALPELSAAEKILLYEGMAFVLPEKHDSEKAEFAAFTLQKAEAAQQEMAAILHPSAPLI